MKVFKPELKWHGIQQVILILIIPCVSAGCFGFGPSKKGGFAIVMPAVMPQYTGPRARLTIADFEVKAAKATNEAGQQLRMMIEEALNSTNRFVFVERMEADKTEGPAEDQTAGPADLIITAAVVEFEPQVSGGSAGIGGGGGEARSSLGGLLGSGTNKAHMALELRVADAASSKVLNSFVVQSQATDISGMQPAGMSLRDGLAAYSRTPMEKAIRICVVESARRIAESIPGTYYKD